MKTNRIMTLVLAAAVLAVITSGTASAYTWDKSIDQSEINSQYSVSYTLTCSGTPDVPAGQQVYFFNNLINNAPYALYPSVNWADSTGQSDSIAKSGTISSNGGRWGPDPMYITSPSAPQGWTDQVTVYHNYGWNHGGNNFYSTTTQSFRIA